MHGATPRSRSCLVVIGTIYGQSEYCLLIVVHLSYSKAFKQKSRSESSSFLNSIRQGKKSRVSVFKLLRQDPTEVVDLIIVDSTRPE